MTELDDLDQDVLDKSGPLWRAMFAYPDTPEGLVRRAQAWDRFIDIGVWVEANSGKPVMLAGRVRKNG